MHVITRKEPIDIPLFFKSKIPCGLPSVAIIYSLDSHNDVVSDPVNNSV